MARTHNAPVVIRDLMKANWNTTNFSISTTNEILLIEEVKRTDLKAQGTSHEGPKVLVYETGWNEEQPDFQHDFNNVTVSISVELWYAAPRTEGNPRTAIANAETVMENFFTEARRVLLGKRKNPGSEWDRIKWTGRRNMSDKTRLIFRYICEIELISRFEANPAEC